MINYALLNTLTDKTLTHPRTGVWYTTDINEAISMQKSALDYVKSIEAEYLCEYIQIIDLETKEIIKTF